jgi:hypothetical protein
MDDDEVERVYKAKLDMVREQGETDLQKQLREKAETE